MKKLCFLLLLALGFVGCKEDDPIPVSDITLDKTALSLDVGETQRLTATVTPENAEDKTVIWMSDKPEIAAVDEGVVTALSAGEATITAQAGQLTATCTVTVQERIMIDKITLDKTTLSLDVDETQRLTATVMPENAEDKTVTWTSDTPDVATVSDQGVVTALSAGKATITAQAGQLTATCTVTVQDRSITAHFDPFFAQVLQDKGIIADAKRIMPEDVKDIKCLLLTNENLTTLRGIEYFESLQQLACMSCQLTSLDISRNTALNELECFGNQLTTLDISNNPALTWVDCSRNQLTTLDVSNNTELLKLQCYENQLSALDLSHNTALKRLNCSNNRLSSLDLSSNTGLIELFCANNQLTELELNSHTDLTSLLCDGNQLSVLDLSANTALIGLFCSHNQLTSLDLSNNTALIAVYCYYNQLNALDLTCNTELTELLCSHNRLTALNVSGNTALHTLNCEENQLTALDLSDNTALIALDCSHNQLTALDLSYNPTLAILHCTHNQLTALNISSNFNLGELFCRHNPGDGALFPVTAWFDNSEIPDDFTTGSWSYEGIEVTIDYRKAD